MLKTCLNHANMETTWLPPMVGTWKPKKSCSLYQWINSISRVCCDGALSIGYHGRTYLVWLTYHSSVSADLGKQAHRAEIAHIMVNMIAYKEIKNENMIAHIMANHT